LVQFPYSTYLIWKLWKKGSWIVKRYGKYRRKVDWIVKRYGKYRIKGGWIVKRYGNYGRKVSWIWKLNQWDGILLACCGFVIDNVNVWYFHNVFRFVFVVCRVLGGISTLLLLVLLLWRSGVNVHGCFCC
jgi:hypothetical protein